MKSDYKRLFAEMIGTAILVLVGCGAVTIGGYGATMPAGIVPIALAFGGILTGLIYALGPVSGCHINPAVTLALWVAGRFQGRQVPGYIAAQVVGGLLGAALLVLLARNGAGGIAAAANLGQNGWGAGYLGEFSMLAAFATEFGVTFIFVMIILGATSEGSNTAFAGVAIGATLAILLVTFVNVTGCSLNPARSIGPAVFAGGAALDQLWLFLIAPSLGGLFAGLVNRVGLLAPVGRSA